MKISKRFTLQVLISLMGFPLIASHLHAESSQSSAWRVSRLQGEVKFNGSAVAAGDVLAADGLLETGAGDAYVDLVLPEGHQMRVQKKAKLKLKSLQPRANSTFELLGGQLYAHLVKGKGGERIHVQTRAVVAGVRGTKFLIEEDLKKGTYVCVCEGTVDVKGRNIKAAGEGERAVNHGQDLWIKPSSKALGQPVDSPGMAQMTSDVFKELEKSL
jgi:hypothetical protein